MIPTNSLVAALAMVLTLGLTATPVQAGSSFSFGFHGGSSFNDGYGKHWNHFRGHRFPRYHGYRGHSGYYGPGGHYGYRPHRGTKNYFYFGPSGHYRGPRPRCMYRYGRWYCR